MLGLLPSVASTIGYSLGYSGTGGAVWGWLVAALFIQATAFSMAELCSSMPTAGKSTKTRLIHHVTNHKFDIQAAYIMLLLFWLQKDGVRFV